MNKIFNSRSDCRLLTFDFLLEKKIPKGLTNRQNVPDLCFLIKKHFPFFFYVMIPLFFTLPGKVFGYLPPSATQLAREVDYLIHFLVILSFITFLLVLFGFVYFGIRYKRVSNTFVPPTITHHVLLEVLWSVIPFIIFMFIFGWGWLLYNKMRAHPVRGALEVHVLAKMWSWDFIYKNGRKSTGVLYVPIDTPVKLVMTSKDVIHSLFVPSFRIKQDVLPGAYTALSFKPDKKGQFHIYCTEFCGAGHSNMLAKIHVMERASWEEWLKLDPYKGLTMEEIGQQVFTQQCTVCHFPSSKDHIGPGLAGIFGTKRYFASGEPKTADENYIRESILTPSKDVSKGFPNAMTPFAGLLTEEQMSGLIEYIKSLTEDKSSDPSQEIPREGKSQAL